MSPPATALLGAALSASLLLPLLFLLWTRVGEALLTRALAEEARLLRIDLRILPGRHDVQGRRRLDPDQLWTPIAEILPDAPGLPSAHARAAALVRIGRILQAARLHARLVPLPIRLPIETRLHVPTWLD